MSEPKRLQLSRRKGSRLPKDAVNVARPSRFGNPFPVGKEGPLGRIAPDNEGAVGHFKAMLDDPEMREACGYPSDDELSQALSGKNLACWCNLTEPHCHADVLIQRVNARAKAMESER